MALPGSGTITWEMIRAEFGGGYPIFMSQYYRGGGLVPNTGANANVPTSGAIGAWHFYNASGLTNTISKSGNASGSQFRAEPAPSSLSVTTNTVTISGSGVTSCTWAFISGTAMSISAPGNGLNASWTASIPKNTTRTATYRATGSNGLTIDVSVSLTYTTDL